MKKFYFPVIVLVISAIVLSITSCKDDDPGLGTYTCTITDSATSALTNWSADKETVALHAGVPLNLIGRSTDSTTLIINLQDPNETDTFFINDNSAHFAKYITGTETFDTYRNYYNSSGWVKLSELSNSKAKGTFELHLSNSFVFQNITNGAFEIDIE